MRRDLIVAALAGLVMLAAFYNYAFDARNDAIANCRLSNYTRQEVNVRSPDLLSLRDVLAAHVEADFHETTDAETHAEYASQLALLGQIRFRHVRGSECERLFGAPWPFGGL